MQKVKWKQINWEQAETYICEDEYIIERLSMALDAEVVSNPLARYAGAIGAALSA